MDSGSLKANVVYPQLKEFKDTVSLYIFTLDFVTNNYPVITAIEVLPFDCFALTWCSITTGGVIILSSNTMQIQQYIRYMIDYGISSTQWMEQMVGERWRRENYDRDLLS